MPYAEIHFHLLPGIDDGPRDLEASVRLAAAAAADGTATIVTTPHIHPEHITDVHVLPGLVSQVSERLRAEGIALELHCGGEIDLAMVQRCSDADLDVIANGAPDARWVLLESPLAGLDASFTAGADELRARGFGVVMAHPERSMRDREAGWAAVEHEIEAGSVIQINAWSVCGRYGDRVAADAMRVARIAPQVALASDAHGPHRPPWLTPAVAQLTRVCGAQTAQRITALSRDLVEHGMPGRRALAA